MITAIIRNKENTLVLELPHSIYDIYEKLQSIGIMQPPKQIPLTDNEDEDIGVKLFSESDFGRHRRAYAYLLNKRGIDREVLNAFFNTGLIYESADYHNAVFPMTTRRNGLPVQL